MYKAKNEDGFISLRGRNPIWTVKGEWIMFQMQNSGDIWFH